MSDQPQNPVWLAKCPECGIPHLFRVPPQIVLGVVYCDVCESTCKIQPPAGDISLELVGGPFDGKTHPMEPGWPIPNLFTLGFHVGDVLEHHEYCPDDEGTKATWKRKMDQPEDGDAAGADQ